MYFLASCFVTDDCSDSDVANLIQEMEVMKIIGRHRNVLNLLGCCTQDGMYQDVFLRKYLPYIIIQMPMYNL